MKKPKKHRHRYDVDVYPEVIGEHEIPYPEDLKCKCTKKKPEKKGSR